MTAQIIEDGWIPFDGALPETVDPNKLYVMPTRSPSEGSGNPRYTDMVRYLPKAARDQNLPLEFATPRGKREYLSEYSVDPDTWSLGLACLQMANSWIIMAVTLFITQRAEHQGWTSTEAEQLPLKVSIVETETGRTVEVEGSGIEVVEALRLIQHSRVERKSANEEGY